MSATPSEPDPDRIDPEAGTPPGGRADDERDAPSTTGEREAQAGVFPPATDAPEAMD